MFQQQQQQHQRIEAERRVYHQQTRPQQLQQQPVSRNESTLTAASLIDAIITHQINQSEGGREVVTNSREPQRAGDRLFQSFHREQPQPIDNNGERPSSVISVDLDGDSVSKNMTVKELTDTVISHDFNARQHYYHHQDKVNEWNRRMQQQQQQQQQSHPKEDKRSGTPQQQDERQIIRIAQQQQQQPQPKYHGVEPISPPEANHWPEQNYRRYAQPPPPPQPQPQSHLSAFDYVKNRIVEVMRTEDDKKDGQDKDRSDSPGDMVIDEEKNDGDAPSVVQVQPSYSYAMDGNRNEPEPLLDSKYEQLSDED